MSHDDRQLTMPTAMVYQVVLILVLLPLAFTNWCPDTCACKFVSTGGDIINCGAGGLERLNFLGRLSVSTRELVIDAPEWFPNKLIIGPLFRRFAAFLQVIAIRRSQVPAIGDNSFFGLRMLKQLDLSWNSITHLSAANFHGLARLQHLRLDHNQIESAPSACFSRLKNLQRLDLSDNRLNQLAPRLLMGLDKLKRLTISRNKLAQLSADALIDVPQLLELQCEECGLSEVSRSLHRYVPQLQLLDLRFNLIADLQHSDFSQLTKLKTLLLAGNQISTLASHQFKRLSLDFLDLSANNLHHLTGDVFSNSTVKNLDLSFNQLENVTDRLLAPLSGSLTFLSLAGSRILATTVQTLILSAPRISRLNLADSNLLAFPDDFFDSVPFLEHVNISDNHLLYVSTRLLRSLTALTSIDLSGNQLSSLSAPLVAKLGSLEEVWLRRNPWACDRCRMKSMLEWIHRSSVFQNACAQHRWESCLRCALPETMAKREISSLEFGDLPECYDRGGEETVLPDECSDIANSNKKVCNHQTSASASASVVGITPSSTPTSFSFWNSSVTLLATLAGFVLLLLVLLTTVASILLCRRQTAVYYTHEERRCLQSEDDNVFDDVNKNNKKVRIVSSHVIPRNDDSRTFV